MGKLITKKIEKNLIKWDNNRENKTNNGRKKATVKCLMFKPRLVPSLMYAQWGKAWFNIQFWTEFNVWIIVLQSLRSSEFRKIESNVLLHKISFLI